MPNVHIVFGTDLLQKRYVDANKLWGQYSVLGTEPDRLENIISFHGLGELKFVTVRYPESVWKPSTHPCEGRVKETERILKESKRLGADVREVEIV